MICHILILKYDVIENNKSEAKSETESKAELN